MDVLVSELRRGQFTDFFELLGISQTNAHEVKLQCFESDLVDNLDEVQMSPRQVKKLETNTDEVKRGEKVTSRGRNKYTQCYLLYIVTVT